MNIESEEEREYAMLFTAKYLHPFLRAFEAGFKDLGLQPLTRSSYPDETGRSVITFMVAGEGFKANVILRGAFEDLLAVDGKADPTRIDLGLEDERYAGEKIAGIVDPLMKILPAALESLEPGPGRNSVTLLDGAFQVALFEPEKWGEQS